MEIKNAEDLLKAIEAKTKATLKKYEEEVAANGVATQAVKDELVKMEAQLAKAKEEKEALFIEWKEWQQKNTGNPTGGSKVKTMAQELKENSEDLKSIAKGLSSTEVLIKADTVRASVSGDENALQLPSVGQLAHAKLTAYDIFTKIPVSDSNTGGTIRYYDWDDATIVRSAAAIAEGAVFPESTAKFIKRTLEIEKVGDTLPVSEEFFEDEAMFAAELGMFLDTNVKIKRNSQIVNGDGVTPNLKGLVTTVSAYTATASGISDANIYDLHVKVSEDITATGGAKYAPNFSFMNIVDINRMKLKKDANENYIIPPFVSRDGGEVAGMVVLEENTITANTMVIGDSRYGRIYEKEGVTLSRGMVNAQFVEDMETLKVRTRLAFLIRGADVGGFRKVTDIDAALVLLATVPA